MIGSCDCCDRQHVPLSHFEETYCGEAFVCFICQGENDSDPYGELEEMQVDRGFSRETVVMCQVDLSSGIAGKIDCIECGGDGDWSKFLPEPINEPCPCVECKGTGRAWIST